mgnify:CR=1 FL=1
MHDQMNSTRRALVGALLLIGGMTPNFLGLVRNARAMSKIPIVPGVQEFTGDFRINGVTARIGQIVKPDDVATTGPNGSAIIIVGQHAFMLREDSEIEFYPEYFSEDEDGTVSGTLKVVSGAMLAVFGKTNNTKITTPLATLGIRGTGCYVESRPERTYACVCYGRAEIISTQTGDVLETVTTNHHDSPRYIYPSGAATLIEKAPVIDHTDVELRLLESIVRRKPPFDTGDAPESGTY